jgi:hypothetical protein
MSFKKHNALQKTVMPSLEMDAKFCYVTGAQNTQKFACKSSRQKITFGF